MQDGANGTLATDDAMFVTFTGNTVNGRYDYNIGMYGVTGTTKTVSATLVDTPPAVVLSGMSGSVQGRQTITVTFNEDVTGFALSDLTLVNATVSDLVTVSASTYTFYLHPVAAGAVSASLGAGQVQDSVQLGNVASNTVAAIFIGAEQQIAQFMQNRANALLSNQPGLRHLLDGSGVPQANIEITRGNGDFDLATGANGPFWMSATGAWSDTNGTDSLYVLGTVGAHSRVSENLLIGGMVELDFARDTNGAAVTEGQGWLVGPYVVAKHANQPLYFEGRLLYGQTSNTISPFGTFEDSFTTERWLAAARVTGDIKRENLILSPFADLSYTSDTQAAFVDGFGNTLAEQSIELGQVKGGLDFRLALAPLTGETTLTGGVSGIWSFEEGTGAAALLTPAYAGGRARVDFGVERATAA
ncbi:MAG: transporter, partial [Marinosulfonomonas sp.]|nr:transporter [Marinosulfonomonas sp.]